jgi:hypothetical protein
MIRAGQSIPASLGDGLARSRFLLIIHSRHHAGSRWAREELDTVRFDEVTSGENKVIVLRYDDTELPFDLRHKKWLDFHRRRKAVLEELAALIGETSGEIIRSVESAMMAGERIVECAHRLGDIARHRRDIGALRALGRLLRSPNLKVVDSAAWAIGYVAIWAEAPDLLEDVRTVIADTVAEGNERRVDKIAYICGEIALDAIDPRLKEWSIALIRRCSLSDNPAVRNPFLYTRERVGI